MFKPRRLVIKIGLALVMLLAVAGFIWFSPYSPYQYGYYIPRNLDQAHAYLEKHVSPKDLQRIRDMKSEEEMIVFHMGLGMYMRNRWHLWSGSSLSRYFNELDIHHPDDMSGIILDTFWCKIHNQPLRLDEKIAYYQAYWKRTTIPKGLKTADGADIYFDRSFDSGTETNPRTIHVGKSSDGAVWIYEHDKGLQPISPEMQKIVDEKFRTLE